MATGEACHLPQHDACFAWQSFFVSPLCTMCQRQHTFLHNSVNCPQPHIAHPFMQKMQRHLTRRSSYAKTCRFEALSTQQAEVDATSEYAAVIRLRLDKLRILLAAEIDCFDPSKVEPGHKPELSSYLELKTHMYAFLPWLSMI